MDRFYSALGKLLIIGMPVWFVIQLCYDLAHPELWSDWRHNPRLYVTEVIILVGIAVPVILWCVAVDYRRTRRHERRMFILNVVNKLLKLKRVQESSDAYRLYRRINAARSRAEEDELAKQFLDTYRV